MKEMQKQFFKQNGRSMEGSPPNYRFSSISVIENETLIGKSIPIHFPFYRFIVILYLVLLPDVCANGQLPLFGEYSGPFMYLENSMEPSKFVLIWIRRLLSSTDFLSQLRSA